MGVKTFKCGDIIFREDDLKDYFLKQPEKLLLIMRDLSSHLRETDDKLAGVCKRIHESMNA